MFTATWPKEVRSLAEDFMIKPKLITIGDTDSLAGASKITQIVQVCDNKSKLSLLLTTLNQIKTNNASANQPFRVLIFCNQKLTVDRLARGIHQAAFSVGTFHGDMSQILRERTLGAFKDGQLNILIASDAASRGLDVKDITCVVNFDFPKDIETYVHRIGRTGRAGATGISLSFFTDDDIRLKNDLMSVLRASNQDIAPELLRF